MEARSNLVNVPEVLFLFSAGLPQMTFKQVSPPGQEGRSLPQEVVDRLQV